MTHDDTWFGEYVGVAAKICTCCLKRDTLGDILRIWVSKFCCRRICTSISINLFPQKLSIYIQCMGTPNKHADQDTPSQYLSISAGRNFICIGIPYTFWWINGRTALPSQYCIHKKSTNAETALLEQPHMQDLKDTVSTGKYKVLQLMSVHVTRALGLSGYQELQPLIPHFTPTKMRTIINRHSCRGAPGSKNARMWKALNVHIM